MLDLMKKLSEIDWGNLEAAWGVAATAAGFFAYHKYRRFTMQRLLRLRVSKDKCAVSLPTYRRHVFNHDQDLVLTREAVPCFSLGHLLSACSVEPRLIAADAAPSLDEIHIGGPLTNEYTNRYVRRYLPGLKWCATARNITNAHEESERMGNKMDLSFLEEVPAEDQVGFRIDGKYYPYRMDQVGLAVLVRLNVAGADTAKTVHLLFGSSTVATVAAVRWFSEKSHRNLRCIFGKKDRIGIFKINEKGEKEGRIRWLDADKLIAK